MRILTKIYLVFYVIIFGQSIFTPATGTPSWFIILEMINFVSAVTCMTLYILEKRPKEYIWLFKIIPFTMIVMDLLSILNGLSDYKFSGGILLLCLIMVSIFAFPSWYICFRFGYLKKFGKGSSNNMLESTPQKLEETTKNAESNSFTADEIFKAIGAVIVIILILERHSVGGFIQKLTASTPDSTTQSQSETQTSNVSSSSSNVDSATSVETTPSNVPSETDIANAEPLDFRKAMFSDYKNGTLVKIQGEVMQVNDNNTLTISTRSVSGVYIDDQVIVSFSNQPRFLVGDPIDIVGSYEGLLNMERLLTHESLKVPHFQAI